LESSSFFLESSFILEPSFFLESSFFGASPSKDEDEEEAEEKEEDEKEEEEELLDRTIVAGHGCGLALPDFPSACILPFFCWVLT
jgi:hypothetical protein